MSVRTDRSILIGTQVKYIVSAIDSLGLVAVESYNHIILDIEDTPNFTVRILALHKRKLRRKKTQARI